MRTIRTIMSAWLLFLSAGCASVKTTGQPFNEQSSSASLIARLDKGLNRLTKKQVKEMVQGVPEILADQNSEKWVYRNSKVRGKLKVALWGTSRIENKTSQELTLVFNKHGVLTHYKLIDQPSQSVENSDYVYKVGEGIIMGIVSGLVLAGVNSLLRK